jgi:hypothetical protein
MCDRIIDEGRSILQTGQEEKVVDPEKGRLEVVVTGGAARNASLETDGFCALVEG